MSAKPSKKPMPQTETGGDKIDRHYRDIIECALNNDFNGVEVALKENPNAINSQRFGSGITPLMAASGRGLIQMVRFLLTKEGIKIDIVDDFGKDAFDHARPFPIIVSLLMQHTRPGLIWREPGIFLT